MAAAVMTTAMAANGLAERRATLWTSRRRWSGTNDFDIFQLVNSNTEKCDEDAGERLITTASNDGSCPQSRCEVDSEMLQETSASSRSKRSNRTIHQLLRSSLDPPAPSRLRSCSSDLSEISVMDVLNMLQDDPEEVLLDMGFGSDEPDITGRIPARFLSYQSSARGINLQIFLEAQQNRMDLENPDVRNRFRQLEVLQQVTTTFTSLVGGSTQDSEPSALSQASTKTLERRKRMAGLLRRAYRKSLNQDKAQNVVTQSSPESSTLDSLNLSRLRDGSRLSPPEQESVSSEAVEEHLISAAQRGTTDLVKLDEPSASSRGTRATSELDMMLKGRSRDQKTMDVSTTDESHKHSATTDSKDSLKAADSDLKHPRNLGTELHVKANDRKDPGGVCSLAYFVQMDPVFYPGEVSDTFPGSSLFEELRSAEICWMSCADEEEAAVMAKPDAGGLHSEVKADGLFGPRFPSALERRRAWSDVIADRDSGTVLTPTASVETSPAQAWSSLDTTGDPGCSRTRSVSLDTGLSCEERDSGLWTRTSRCFHCGSPVSRGNHRRSEVQPERSCNPPYSLDELEDMMKSMSKFRAVLMEIESKLEKEQKPVLDRLSESVREEVEDVWRLRAAVKLEAEMLEQQLCDLAHHYDGSIRTKLTRLLDEQSHLCSLLRIRSGDGSGPEVSSSKSVSVQCCIPQCCTCRENPGLTEQIINSKSDRLDLVAFIKNLKNSLRHKINSSPLE